MLRQITWALLLGILTAHSTLAAPPAALLAQNDRLPLGTSQDEAGPLDLQIGTIELARGKLVLVQREQPDYAVRIHLEAGRFEKALKALAGTDLQVRIRGIVRFNRVPDEAPVLHGGSGPRPNPGKFTTVEVMGFTVFSADRGDTGSPEAREEAIRSLVIAFIEKLPHSRSEGAPMIRIFPGNKWATVRVTIPHFSDPSRIMRTYTLLVDVDAKIVKHRGGD